MLEAVFVFCLLEHNLLEQDCRNHGMGGADLMVKMGPSVL